MEYVQNQTFTTWKDAENPSARRYPQLSEPVLYLPRVLHVLLQPHGLRTCCSVWPLVRAAWLIPSLLSGFDSNGTFLLQSFLFTLFKIATPGTSLVVQWLRFCAPNVRGLVSSIPGQWTSVHLLQLKNLQAAIKTQHRQIIIKKKKRLQLHPITSLSIHFPWHIFSTILDECLPCMRHCSSPSDILNILLTHLSNFLFTRPCRI